MKLLKIIYLLEPLPHVAFIDKFTYPIADSLALAVMGILCGLLLGEKQQLNDMEKTKWFSIIPAVTITACFFHGRVMQYTVLDIYSSFRESKVETLIWCFIAGVVTAITLLWLNQFVTTRKRYLRAFWVGIMFFGINVTFFNFFMPLVFNSNIVDLIVRTCFDVFTITIGCFLLPQFKYERN